MRLWKVRRDIAGVLGHPLIALRRQRGMLLITSVTQPDASRTMASLNGPTDPFYTHPLAGHVCIYYILELVGS